MYINRWLRFCIGLASLSLAGPLFGQFLYVGANGNLGAQVWGYTINANTGVLTLIPGSPFSVEDSPTDLTIDPTGRFLYVGSDYGVTGPGRFSGFRIDPSTGALTPIPGSPFPSVRWPTSVAVNPAGNFAYAASALLGETSGYSINGSTGALTPLPGSPFSVGESFFAQVDPNGKFLYESVLFGGLKQISIDPDSGALQATVSAGANECWNNGTTYAIGPTGKYVYAVAGCISAYDVGTLSPVPGSPFPGSPFPNDPSSSGPGSVAIAVDPTGRFAYPVGYYVYGLAISPDDGSMAALPGSIFVAPYGSGWTWPAVDPTGNFLYVGVQLPTFSGIYGFSINSTTGALTPIFGAPLLGGVPGSLASAIELPAGVTATSMAITPPRPSVPGPTVISVSPSSGSGTNQMFAFQFSDPQGYRNLAVTSIDFSSYVWAENRCEVEVLPRANELYLMNDGGTAALGPVTLGTAGTVSNSRCTLDAGHSSISGSGNILTLNLAFTFTPAFAGQQNVYLCALDLAGLKTPQWQQWGTWFVP